MRKTNLLKMAALITASAYIFSTSGSISNVVKNESKETPEKSVSVSVVSEESRTSSVEKLKNAFEENGETLSLCDEIIREVNIEKEKLDLDVIDISDWADDVIIARQEKYEHELSIKYAETIEALTELKNGENINENLEIINKNLSEPEEYHKSDAVPNTAVDISDISLVPGTRSAQSVEITSPEPSSDDLIYDADTVYPEVIKTFAEKLGDVNSIYLYVKNNIYFEAYSGSKKGATVTLEQQGGNDIDQASLLIAMLRAINIPSRFVGGTIRITAEQAVDITGAADAVSAGRILASRYKNVTGITYNGQLIGYKMYHTWVEAYIPYTDYRGAGNKSGSKIWVQLDPSFKKLEKVSESIVPEYTVEDKALLKTISDNAELYPNIYKSMEPMPESINYNGTTIVSTNEKYIPTSLPYTVLSVDERYSFVKNSDKDSISIEINGETLFSSPISELYYNKINISYEPATDYDRSVMEHYEKITDVPAYLVNVVPVVTVGDKKYAGSEEASLGSMQQMITTIRNNGGTTMLDDSVYCGSMYAINLDLQRISPEDAEAAEKRLVKAEQIFTTANACSTDVLGSMLDYAGKYYFSLCDAQSMIQAAIMDINQTRQLALAITGYQFHRLSSFGIVRSLDFGAFYIDVAYNNVAALSLTGDKSAERKYMMSAGAVESFYESYIWQQLIDNESTCISTVSVFDIAHDQGIKSRYICSANLEDELSQCNINDSVKTEIRNFVNRGLLVEIVPETLTIGDWTGTAYIAMNMDNGSASYMISGGTAGGSSMNFEDLFNLNMRLFVINTEFTCASMMKGVVNFECGVFTYNGAKLFEGASSLIGGAFTLASAFQMRYDAIDFILRYAEEGEDCMKEFKIMTARNLLDTFFNVVAACGDLIGGAAGDVTGWTATIYSYITYFSDPDFKDSDSDERLTNSIPVIWDLISKLISKQL